MGMRLFMQGPAADWAP